MIKPTPFFGKHKLTAGMKQSKLISSLGGLNSEWAGNSLIPSIIPTRGAGNSTLIKNHEAEMNLSLQILNPLDRPDWDDLLLRSGDQSFFHTSSWAKVMERTYGYKPVYFASFEGDRLDFLMPFMEVSSLVTGRRGVSLPFADQCRPHISQGYMGKMSKEAINQAIAYGSRAKWRYIEWRDARYFDETVLPSDVYYAHDLDLMGSEADIFSRLKDNNQRNIRKAVREGVSVKIDQSLDSVKSFYRLNCATRKRHGLPPQPFSFFQNVFEYLISNGHGIVVSASHSDRVIAASIFFHFGARSIFKYGASDMDYQSLRPNNLIMWEAIKWYKSKASETLSLGRTEINNHGLLNFKRSWGATESTFKYFRYDVKKKLYIQKPASGDLHNKIFAHTPAFVLRFVGRLLYKHVG